MSSTPAEKTQIIIISKSGSLSECIVETNKETTLDELTNILSTKCGNKKSDGFSCYHTYKYKNKKKNNNKHTNVSPAVASAPMIYIDVWCKTDGRAGQENKYELPPPIDEIIFFGNMALVARVDKQTACDLSIELWNKIYEKLFGGFEDLAATAQEDENEIDELAFVPASKKTANGYLKDGFVVDDSIGSSGSGSTGNSSTGNSDDDLVIQKKKAGGGGKKKSKTKKSDSTTESEFVTETETETDSISDSEIRSDSSNDTPTATSSVTATPTQTITVTATATATVTPAVTVKANKKTKTKTTTTTTTNRKIAPSVKKTPVAKKATKKDEMKTAAVSAAAAASSAASSVSAILGNSSDSELSEDSYST